MYRALKAATGKEVDPATLRTYTNTKLSVSYVYVPLAALSESNCKKLVSKDRFTSVRCTFPELWSCRYILYRTQVGSFAPGEKEAVVSAIKANCTGDVHHSYNSTYRNSHYGTVTVSSLSQVSTFIEL